VHRLIDQLEMLLEGNACLDGVVMRVTRQPQAFLLSLFGYAKIDCMIEQAKNTLHLLERITVQPGVMGGKPTIRGLRVTVGTILGLLAAGHPIEAILQAYPYLEEADIRAALQYAAWRVEEVDLPLNA
jgi:uncharacterized protein (DUF433 family)